MPCTYYKALAPTPISASMVTIAIPAMMSLFFDGRRAGSRVCAGWPKCSSLNIPSASSADMLPVIKLLSAISCPFLYCSETKPCNLFLRILRFFDRRVPLRQIGQIRARKPLSGNVTLLYKLNGSTGNWRNSLTPVYYKCSEDKGGQLGTTAPIGSSLYPNSHDRLFCICLISGKLAFELQVPWSTSLI